MLDRAPALSFAAIHGRLGCLRSAPGGLKRDVGGRRAALWVITDQGTVAPA